MENNNRMTDQVKGTPMTMDELLKAMVVDKWGLAIDYAISGRLLEAFMAYRALFYLIEPYDFEMKATLSELNDILAEYVEQLQGRPLDSHATVLFQNRKRQFRDLLTLYMSHLPKAYAELGVWFKVSTHFADPDKLISFEMYGDEMTQIKDRREQLLKLKTAELVNMMKPSHIHDLYARWRVENAV